MCRKKLPSGSSLAPLAAAFAFAAVGPASAEVVEIRSSLSVQERYDSNALSQESGEEQHDFTTELVPNLTANWRGDQGNLAGLVELRAKRHSEFDAYDGVDRTFGYDTSYALAPRLRFASSGRLWHYEETDEVVESAPGLPSVVVLGASPGLDAHYWSGTASYALSPRTDVSFTPSVWSQDFENVDGPRFAQYTDSRSLSGEIKLNRRLGPYDSTYLAFSRSDNEFTGRGADFDSRSESYEASAGWIRAWSDRWASTLSIGVNRLTSDQKDQVFELVSTGGQPAGFFEYSLDDTSLSGVGGAKLTRFGQRTTFELQVSQRVSPSSGYGSDVTVLGASSSLTWRLNSRWTFDAGASSSHYESATKRGLPILLPAFTPGTGCPGSGLPVLDPAQSPVCLYELESESALDYIQYSLGGALRWQMSRRFSTFVDYRYTKLTSSGDRPLTEYDNNTIWFGFAYRYDVDLY